MKVTMSAIPQSLLFGLGQPVVCSGGLRELGRCRWVAEGGSFEGLKRGR